MLLKYDIDDIVKYLTGSSLLDISNLLYEAVQEYELDQQRRQNERKSDCQAITKSPKKGKLMDTRT